ncbi:MAG TPA: AAA family ATPase [Geminicoccaceae bacterium]
MGQGRALDALHFGIGIRHDRYHLFALGPQGVAMHAVLRGELESLAAKQKAPPDWCYVHNFGEPHRPRKLRLPAGRGAELRHAVEELIVELRAAIPAAFESDDFRDRRQAIEDAAKQRQEDAFSELQEGAQVRGVALLRTPVGLALAPVRNGEVVPPDEFRKLPPEEQERIKADLEELQHQLETILQAMPRLERQFRAELRQLAREVTTAAVRHLLDDLRSTFRDLADVLNHVEAMEQDLIDNAEQLVGDTHPEVRPGPQGPLEGDRFRRYRVNLLVDHGASEGAPVVYEDHPTFQNLLGRVEHVAQFGTLITDFNLIKPGALHRANGGYLLLDARRVLLQPFAWEELKRVLRAGEIRIEELAQTLGLVSTVSLEPESIPLDIKVVLIGERRLYYLLCELDPDFGELFKVPLDFADDVDRTSETTVRYAGFVARLARERQLRPLERGAIARMVEVASRIAEDATKLSVHRRTIGDLLLEADHHAGHAGHAQITAADIDAARDARIHRADRVRERVLEQIRRGTILIDTSGAAVGQVNGLVVSTLGDFTFGRPIRITARTRLGRGEVVDIEREVEFGGPIHAKGILILQGFLGQRYAAGHPLTLHASLVFEQSYGPVEGDSASVAELAALLSALAGVPIRQNLAVTGSVNQHGRVQAIGGVNEKVEGFHDVCRQAGDSGEYGVIIPRANVEHLMLRDDVVESVRSGRFNVFAASTIDEVMEALTGMTAGERDAEGAFREGSVNGRIEARLCEMAETVRHFGSRDGGDAGGR